MISRQHTPIVRISKVSIFVVVTRLHLWISRRPVFFLDQHLRRSGTALWSVNREMQDFRISPSTFGNAKLNCHQDLYISLLYQHEQAPCGVGMTASVPDETSKELYASSTASTWTGPCKVGMIDRDKWGALCADIDTGAIWKSSDAGIDCILVLINVQRKVAEKAHEEVSIWIPFWLKVHELMAISLPKKMQKARYIPLHFCVWIRIADEVKQQKQTMKQHSQWCTHCTGLDVPLLHANRKLMLHSFLSFCLSRQWSPENHQCLSKVMQWHARFRVVCWQDFSMFNNWLPAWAMLTRKQDTEGNKCSA